MLKVRLLSIVFLSLLFFVPNSYASDITEFQIKTNFNIWDASINYYDLVDDVKSLEWQGLPVKFDSGDSDLAFNKFGSQLNEVSQRTINKASLFRYLDRYVKPDIFREKRDVSIDLSEKSGVTFEGFALSGQEIDYLLAHRVFERAYLSNEKSVRLPIKTVPPNVVVKSEDLYNKGITQLISTGETDFSGSPGNRLNNIKIGLASFNGQLIAPGEESGAGKILGRVDETTGYKEELVIKGDKTIPEYGGGLCQVSTTVYRSLLFAGVPITQRRNHSYAVSYYDPQGLDATIYPPYVDMKFINDTDGHILIQTLTTKEGKAYANVYGTPKKRLVDLVGPYYYDYKKAPPPRTEYTTELKPGEKQIVGNSHDGFKASWYRRILSDEGEKVEHIYSDYQPRPLYTLIGEVSSEHEN